MGPDGRDLPRNRIRHKPRTDVRASERPSYLPARHPAELELAVELHRHLLGDCRIDRRADDIVDGREPRLVAMIEHREVLAVRVTVADNEIKDNAIHERQHISARKVQAFQETGALGDGRAALVLILDLGTAPEQLAEVLLMQTTHLSIDCFTVITLRDIVIGVPDSDNFTLRRVKSAKRREPHAEILIVNRLGEAVDSRLDDVGGRRSVRHIRHQNSIHRPRQSLLRYVRQKGKSQSEDKPLR